MDNCVNPCWICFVFNCRYFFKSVLNLGNDNSDPTIFGEYQAVDESIEVRFPASWILFQTPNGNHGDLEDIAGASAIGSFVPRMLVFRRTSLNSDVDLIVEWRERRIKEQKELQAYWPDEVVSYSSSYITGLTKEYSFYIQNPINTDITKCKDLYFVYNKNDYIFSLCDPANDWVTYSPIFDNIINSIQPINK